MKSSIRKNWPRYTLQWGVLAALILFITGLAKWVIPSLEAADPEHYCPVGGLQALTTFFVRGSLPCTMSSVQIVMGIALAAAVILFSKLFCAYICPVGTVQDLLSKLRAKLKIKGIRPDSDSVLDKVLRIVKYVLVFVVFYMTATRSELFCKNFDPYYAAATGFKGEITLWAALASTFAVLVCSFFIENFWCRYLCPLGALSNAFKFWVWIGVLFGVWFVLAAVGVNMPWWILLALFCLVGYCLEIFCAKPKLQLLHVVKDADACSGCGLCEKACPHAVKLTALKGGNVNSVDCTLCGECVASCAKGALQVGVCPKAKGKCWKYVPACLTVVLVVLGMWLGSRPSMEVPTINETWGIEVMGADSVVRQVVDPSTLKTMEVTGLKSVKCFGSSRAFMNKLMGIKGVHGVKTYVGHHRAIITYDPAKTDEDTIREEIFVPVQVKTDKHPELIADNPIKVITIRTENMFDRMDFTYLGLQFRQTDKLIYGLESEFACPLIVRLFVDPSEEISEEWVKSIVEKPELVTTNPKTGEVIKTIPTDYKFVKMEKEVEEITVKEFVHKMFSGFDSGVFNGRYTDENGNEFVQKRDTTYMDQPQFIYEIADENYDKPIFKRTNAFMFLSNHISKEEGEGIISLKVEINEDLIPAIRIRYAAPMTPEKIWEMINQDPWTITYSKDDVREVPAKIKFEKEGIVRPYVNE